MAQGLSMRRTVFIFRRLKIIRFGLAGALSTLFALASFPVIYYFFGQNTYFAASYVSASFLNIVVSYVLQRKYVFRSKHNILRQFIKFVSVAILLSASAYIFVFIAIQVYGFSTFTSNGFAVALSAVVSFLVSDRFTFADRPQSESESHY